jgi:hypothetical protein
MKKPEVATEVAVPLGTGTDTVPVRRPCPGKCCGQGIRELGLPKVLSETACRGDDRWTFDNWDGG